MILSIKHRVVGIFLACLLLCNFANGALAASTIVRASIRADSVYISVSRARYAEEAQICFSTTCRSRPNINF